jgi:hypothetical protein
MRVQWLHDLANFNPVPTTKQAFEFGITVDLRFLDWVLQTMKSFPF